MWPDSGVQLTIREHKFRWNSSIFSWIPSIQASVHHPTETVLVKANVTFMLLNPRVCSQSSSYLTHQQHQTHLILELPSSLGSKHTTFCQSFFHVFDLSSLISLVSSQFSASDLGLQGFTAWTSFPSFTSVVASPSLMPSKTSVQWWFQFLWVLTP